MQVRGRVRGRGRVRARAGARVSVRVRARARVGIVSRSSRLPGSGARAITGRKEEADCTWLGTRVRVRVRVRLRVRARARARARGGRRRPIAPCSAPRDTPVWRRWVQHSRRSASLFRVRVRVRVKVTVRVRGTYYTLRLYLPWTIWRSGRATRCARSAPGRAPGGGS